MLFIRDHESVLQRYISYETAHPLLQEHLYGLSGSRLPQYLRLVYCMLWEMLVCSTCGRLSENLLSMINLYALMVSSAEFGATDAMQTCDFV